MKKLNLIFKKIMVMCIAITLTLQGVQANTAQQIANIITTRTAGDLTASVSGSTVTVTGNIPVTIAENADYLSFGINDNVTVIWRAYLRGLPNSNFSLININAGSGTFRMESGAIENNGTGRAITNNSTSAINITGGIVSAGYNTAVHNSFTGVITISGSTTRVTSANSSSNSGTIFLNNENSGTVDAVRLIINSGIVENTSIGWNSNAIRNHTSAQNWDTRTATVNILGGIVSAVNGSAVSNSIRGTVTVSGGAISTITGTAINNSSGVVTISGGTTSTTTGIAISGGTITISGGTVSATTGTAINNPQGTVTISGNTTRITSANTSTSSGTISGSNVTVNGGIVENTSTAGTQRNAIFTQIGTVTITNGAVRSENGIAINQPSIQTWNASTINVSGGTVSTSGNGMSAINNQSGTVRIIGGTISASRDADIAINTGNNTTVTFGRTPTITGRIFIHYDNFSVINTGADIFAPGSRVYTLDFPTWGDQARVAVVNGGNFLANFRLHNPGWALQAVGGNLVTARARIVSFDLNGAPGTAPADMSVAQGGTLTSLPTVSRTGYDFRGWFTQATGGTEVTTNTPISTDMTVFARWQRSQATVTFNRNGAPGTTPPVTVTQGGTLTSLPANPTWTGRNFVGWFSTSSQTGGEQLTTSTTINSNRTFWARWTLQTFTITYNLNGGTNHNANPSTFTVTTPTITLQAPTRQGYFFDGWFSNANFTGARQTTIATGSTGNRTFWARWLSAFTITFDPNGGEVAPTFGTTGQGGTLTAGLPTPTREGYTFVGWFTQIAGGTQVTANTTFNSDGTIFARWSLNRYRITFDATGGNVTPAFDSTGIGWVLTYLPTPTKIGHSFNGWFTSAINGEEITTNTVFSANATIFAQWTINTYTVTFNSRGGSAIDEQIIAHGSKVTTPTYPPTRTDFTFGGWFRDAEIINVWDFYTDVITSDTTLYAKWISNPTLLDSIANLLDSIDRLNQLLTACEGDLVETHNYASLQRDTINYQRTTINSQRDTINDLRLFVVELVKINDDLLDTIAWLREMLAICENNSTNVVLGGQTPPLRVAQTHACRSYQTIPPHHPIAIRA